MTATATQPTTLRRSVDLRTLERESGIAYSTLRQWISEGRLKAYKVGGTKVRVLVDDFNALFRPVNHVNATCDNATEDGV